jgi:glycosyltransferase involved in cell wall biosynthesis
MKIAIISSSDIQGGAAKSAYRLHQGLRKNHITSQMLVQSPNINDSTVCGMQQRHDVSNAVGVLRLALDHLPLKRYPQRQRSGFSPQWLPDRVKSHVDQFNPDIVNLHWVAEGFLRIETLPTFKQPLVWTLHDMWTFTGGCHYTQGCDRYTQSCGTCPYLGSDLESDLSRSIWQRKARAWKSLNLTVVAPNRWMADCARASSLFKNQRIERIPNGIDTNIYRPIDRTTARTLLKLPQDKTLVLFGAANATSDPRKGFPFLQAALQDLSQANTLQSLELVVFGASPPTQAQEFGFKTHYLGTLKDDLTLALLYSAADVFILPSTEENLANTVMEALACGTPCVAFRLGGTPDMIEHQQNGYLATPLDVTDLAQGIVWVLEQPERYQKLCDRARQKVEQEFTLDIQARRYHALFSDLMAPQLQPLPIPQPHLNILTH